MKIILVGYGTMGQNLKELIDNSSHEIVAIVGNKKDEMINFKTADFDVLVDFSAPSNLLSILSFIKKHKKPAVICTTGYNESQKNAINETSKHVPIVYSQNMSVGISVMKKAIKEINKLLNYEYDVEITEIHHNRKIDAPSGTAYLLGEALQEDYEYQLTSRPFGNQPKGKNELAIHAIRGGGVPGEHSVFFFAEEEYLEVKHVVLSRKLFCRGALKAAEFIINQKPSLYSMDDVINE